MAKISVSVSLVAGSFAALLSSCASPPITKPDLSNSVYSSRHASTRGETLVRSVEIRNTFKPDNAPDVGHMMDWNFAPMTVSEPTGKTIEDDLSDYFAKTTTTVEKSDFRIIATITKANAYEAHKANGSAFIPLVGIFTGSDAKIGIDLVVKFEIERAGKVVKDWTYNQRIERGTHSYNSRENDYKEIMAAYRDDFFRSVDDQVIRFVHESELGIKTASTGTKP